MGTGIKNRKKLIKECTELPYSQDGVLNEDTICSTDSRLSELYDEFGRADVLGALSGIWTFEKALLFFEQRGIKKHHRPIRTIATSYRKACNGGVERVNAELMKLWMEMGYKVILFTEFPENELDYPYPSSVKRIVIPSTDKIDERLLYLEKHCKEEAVDTFINHISDDLNSLWEMVLMNLLEIPYIQYCNTHFSWCIEGDYPYYHRPGFYKLCDLILALSETDARFYQLCGCSTYQLNNPVPSDLRRNAVPASLDSGHVLMIGRLSWEKYPLEALQIIKLVYAKKPDVIFDIVGDGDMMDKARQFVRENNLESVVVFHGEKGCEETAQFYKKASCVLLTSRLEGYSMVILEAKAYGVPVVMYELPYLSLVKDGKGIMASPAGNIKEMSENIIRILEDEEYRKRLGKEARESFEFFDGYDLQGNWDNIYKLLSGSYVENEPAYYDPSNVDNRDKYVMPVMFNRIIDANIKVKNRYENSRDYKLGMSILYLPRKIKSFLLKLIRVD